MSNHGPNEQVLEPSTKTNHRNSRDTIPIRPTINQVLCPQNTYIDTGLGASGYLINFLNVQPVSLPAAKTTSYSSRL